MYLRLMKLKMLPGKFAEIEAYYRERVLPSLEGTPGCLCGTLTEDVGEGVCISLTLWSDPESIRRYEEGGLFQDLIEGVQPWLADSSEWRFQLNENLELEYGPAKEEPTVRAYGVRTASRDDVLCESDAEGAYLRLLRINVTAGPRRGLPQVVRARRDSEVQGREGVPLRIAVEQSERGESARLDDLVGLEGRRRGIRAQRRLSTDVAERPRNIGGRALACRASRAEARCCRLRRKACRPRSCRWSKAGGSSLAKWRTSKLGRSIR